MGIDKWSADWAWCPVGQQDKIFPFTIFINISTLTRLGLFVKLFAYSDKNDKIHSVFDEQKKFAVGRQEMGF